MMHKAWRSLEEVSYCFFRSSIKFEDHPGPENCRFESNLSNITHSYQIPQIGLVFFKLWPSSSMNGSVHPSVTTFSLFVSSYHHEIFRSNYHWQKWCPCKKSSSEVKRQGQRAKKKFYPNLGFSGPKLQFWLHRWLWNYAQSLKCHRRRALFKVILEISRSHRTKTSSIFTRIERFRTVTPVWIHQWFWNDAQSLKYHRRGALLFFKVRWFDKFQGHTGQNFNVIRQILSL